MRTTGHWVEQLSQLHAMTSVEDQRAVWRQSIAQLAAAAADQRPVPLEGANPSDLVASARIALSTQLIDDVDWLSPPAAAAAIHELAAALPNGPERRELARRAFARMEHGDGATFVALATALALGTTDGVGAQTLRSRVALSLALPIGGGTQVDAMALALISHRELQVEFLVQPAMGSLPSRRLAARLLERAAREAARRASLGDDGGLNTFASESVSAVWRKLLADRESLVWRHVATARGLLSVAHGELDAEIERNLLPELSPTEWRRAAASLAARIAVAPSLALGRARALLSSQLFVKDRGLAGAMLFGLPRAAEIEPETAEQLLDSLVEIGGNYAIESLIELLREPTPAGFGARSAQQAAQRLRAEIERDKAPDSSQRANATLLLDQLGAAQAGRGITLGAAFSRALEAYGERSAGAAFEVAQAGLGELEAALDKLENTDEGTPQGRYDVMRWLSDIDARLLQSSLVHDLLSLGGEPGQAAKKRVDELFERLTEWLLAHESAAANGGKADATLRMRRLVALLHLMDAEWAHAPESSSGPSARVRSARVLLAELAGQPAAAFRRVMCATLARAFDAMARQDAFEISDVLLVVSSNLSSLDDLQTLGEASMAPEIEAGLFALAQLLRLIATPANDGAARRYRLDAMRALMASLPSASSPRVAALRRGLLDLHRSLESLAALRSLTELDQNGIALLDQATHTLAQLLTGASRRVFGTAQRGTPAFAEPMRELGRTLEQVRSSAQRLPSLDSAITSLQNALVAALPAWLAQTMLCVLDALRRLPVRAAVSNNNNSLPPPAHTRPLPPWVPPNRTLGGFYIVEPLGEGAGGSVFVVKRADERHKLNAERFALKVPFYDGQAARSLSELEFLKLFREEAGALLSLPDDHPNIARFVTFDAGVKPKPVLVMELVEGLALGRLLERRALNMTDALHILDSTAKGLEAMHKLGIAHLDLKPLNVVLRGYGGHHDIFRSQNGTPKLEPVLVDFGLSGRVLRPGCATANYGAPEVWGFSNGTPFTDPRPTDVYAFVCLAFEMFTATDLFTAPNEMGMIGAHISHDGMPAPLAQLAQDPQLAPLAECLSKGLRRNAADRATITQLRESLAKLRPSLTQLPWPLVNKAAHRAA